ncbi:hypothetical protein [Sphingobium yanoikuyae]|uniref:hypothetical protein n=1 Tax=Sphingobium yanoikuyae TaxID=13690 RepID=UPI00345ED5FA
MRRPPRSTPPWDRSSPTHFYLGKIRFDEWTSNLDFSKELDIGLAGPLSVAVGAEYKKNNFLIGPGDPESYIDGGYVSPAGSWLAGATRTGVGSQGVTGFLPEGSGSWSRDNWSAYINLEGQIVEGLEFGLAGRHEDYSDFGTTDTGKASLRIGAVSRLCHSRAPPAPAFARPTLAAATISLHPPRLQRPRVNGSERETKLLPVARRCRSTLGCRAGAGGRSRWKPEKGRSQLFPRGIVLTPGPQVSTSRSMPYQYSRCQGAYPASTETLSGPVGHGCAGRRLAYQGIAGGLIFSNAGSPRHAHPRGLGHSSAPIGPGWATLAPRTNSLARPISIQRPSSHH